MTAIDADNRPVVRAAAAARLPILEHGEFDIKIFETVDGDEHVALTKPPLDTEAPVLVRLHSECLTGDVFGSVRCDCGEQLDAALALIGTGGGVLVYLRQEGRGIGLANKIKAYTLQEQGLDTVEANQALGFEADQREYHVAAQMLLQLGVRRVRLLTNNPHKLSGLASEGIEVVERVPLEIRARSENENYLATKRRKLGHLLSGD